MIERKMVETQQYKPIYENAVYSRGITITQEIEKILILRRFTEATQDEIMNYLQKEARKYQNVRLLDNPDILKGKNSLESLIIALSNRMKDGIVEENSGFRECLEKAYFSPTGIPKTKDNDLFLNILYGEIPSKVINNNRKLGKITNSSWYDAAFKNEELLRGGHGLKFFMNLKLQNKNLPDKKEMDTLLKYGVHSSDILNIKGDYSTEDVKEIIGFLYNNFSSDRKILSLRDVSEEYIHEAASIPIVKIHKILQKSISSLDVVNLFSEILKHIVAEDGNKTPFRFTGPSSETVN